MKAAGQAKAPLVHSEALVWILSCVNDFGAGALPVTQVVAFAASELEHVNPKVCHLLQFLYVIVLSQLSDSCARHSSTHDWCGWSVETVAKVCYRNLIDAKIRCASLVAVPIEDLTLQVSN